MIITYYKGYAIEQMKKGLWRMVLSPNEHYSTYESIKKHIDRIYDKKDWRL